MIIRCLLLLVLCSRALFAQTDIPPPDTAYIWRQATGGEVIGKPTVQAQSVVVALDGGTVKAFSATGNLLWTYLSRGRLSPYITRSREGTSYICRTNGNLIAVNRIGKELWRVHTGGALSGPIILGWDGRLFVPVAQKVLCYTASGNLLWTRELDDAISAGPWPEKGGILLALKNADAVRIDPYGVVASRRLAAVPSVLVSGASMMALYENGNIQIVNINPAIAPVDLPRLPAAPLAAAYRGGYLAVALANGQVILLSGADGKIQWTGDTHMRVYQERRGRAPDAVAEVMYNERGIYVFNKNGATAFSTDGRRLWFTILENSSGIPALDEEGVLYSGASDWILYAWKLEYRSEKSKQSFYGSTPDGFYGVGIYPPAPTSAVFDDSQTGRELENMRREIMAGRVGDNERQWLVYLMNVAGSGSRPGMTPNDQSGAQINHRVLALQLLSRIGSCETIPWLVRLFRMDSEPLVKAAAAHAIGGIGVDPAGVAMKEFLAASSEDYDERVLVSVAAATGILCRFAGPPLFSDGARILVSLTNPDKPPSVQRQAQYELNIIKK